MIVEILMVIYIIILAIIKSYYVLMRAVIDGHIMKIIDFKEARYHMVKLF